MREQQTGAQSKDQEKGGAPLLLVCSARSASEVLSWMWCGLWGPRSDNDGTPVPFYGAVVVYGVGLWGHDGTRRAVNKKTSYNII